MGVSTISSSLSNLMSSQSADTYKATASLKDGSLDAASTVVYGDTKSGLFGKETKELKKDDFLKLLMTQLQNQDPLSPMDNAAMLTQMAQMQSIESNNNIQSALTGLQDSFKGTVDAQRSSAVAMTNASSVSLIGKNVRLKQTTINYYPSTDRNAKLNINLGDRTSTQCAIVDANGTVIKTLDVGNKNSDNSATVVWDGSTDSGETAKTGTYGISFPDDPQSSTLYAFVQDTVTGVRFNGESALVKIAGKEIPVTNIMDVSGSADGSAQSESASAASSVGLLGKLVRTRKDDFYFGAKENEAITLDIAMQGQAKATVSILDSKGKTVATMPVTADGTGKGSVSWNGRLDNGVDFAPAGKYTIKMNDASVRAGAYSYDEGVVMGVTTISGSTQIRIGSLLIPIAKVVEIATV